MPKNIVILLDGTSNEIEADRTNILRLYGCLTKSADQIAYYDPGVGTMGGSNTWSRYVSKAAEFWGMATGWGLDANVKDAYRFLAENFDPGGKDEEPDTIAIFGFSRGAYSARVLAGFINAVGLMAPSNLNLLDYAYRAYKRIGEGKQAPDPAADNKSKEFGEVQLFERILNGHRPPIRMLGLFDTVASVIESGRFGPRLKSHAFTSNNPSVQTIAHAVAIDERRTMFRPQLWGDARQYYGGPFKNRPPVAQEVHEVWFAGVHGDVGGGSPERESGLCKVPLVWMIDHAKRCGLRFNTKSINTIVYDKYQSGKYVPPDPMGPMHDSMKKFWPIVEFLPRKKPADSSRFALAGLTIPLFERRHIPAGATIHESVALRQSGGGYRPENIPPP